MARIQGTFLSSAIGRRLFVLFLLASVLPLSLMAALTYVGVASVLSHQASAELSREAKSAAMDVLSRLQAARDALDQAQSRPASAAARQVFRSLAQVDGATGAATFLQGPAIPAALVQRMIARAREPGISASDTAIVVLPSGDPDRPWLAMVRPHAQPDHHGGMAVALLDPAGLFPEIESLPSQTDLCVVAGDGVAAFCSDPRRRADALRAAGSRLPGSGEDAAPPGWDQGVFTLFLNTDFRSPEWRFVALRPQQSGLFSSRQAGALYAAIGVAALLLAALLSLTQIRRLMQPLEELVEGTRRVAGLDFSRPLAEERKDEFGRLAGAFNSMARGLDSRIAELETLARMDRDMLAGATMDRIVDTALERMERLAQASRCAIALIACGENGQVELSTWVRTAGAPGLRRALHHDPAWFPVLEQGERTLARSPAAPLDTAFLDALCGPGTPRCHCIPVRCRGGSWVVMALIDAPQSPSEEQLLAPARALAQRLGIAVDAADREASLRHEARHDSLTGLPNRRSFHEAVEGRIASEDTRNLPFAVLFIDLDRFKGVNDGLGHDAGDALLKQAADRIQRCLEAGDVVARLGGDEFTVLAQAPGSHAAVEALADRIIEALSGAYWIGALEVYVSASIGITHYPEDASSREALLRNADIAMYQAKKSGRGRHALYRDSMSRPAVDLLVLEKDLRTALARDDIQVHYQPRVRLADRSLAGGEALARWQHPVRGFVPPASFITLAEEIGLIERLGLSVLHQTCAALAQWRADGLAVGALSVNLSTRQLRSADLAEEVTGIVARAGLRPQDIEFEITESALAEDLDSTCETLQRLRAAGFAIALDDFGTGYSSLAYLQNLPIDVMKIDRSFVSDLGTRAGSRAIAQAIITMAHTLGLRVVAEGVETAEQEALLRAWGCDEGQGYWFARPMPPHQFAEHAAGTVLTSHI